MSVNKLYVPSLYLHYIYVYVCMYVFLFVFLVSSLPLVSHLVQVKVRGQPQNTGLQTHCSSGGFHDGVSNKQTPETDQRLS